MNENIFYLFIIVAASATGKGTLLSQLAQENLWKMIPKYSTRDYRGKTDDVVYISDKSVVEIEKTKNEREIRYARMEYIISVCGSGKGVVYYKNENIYGVCINDIVRGLESSNVAVVISDFHAIRALRKFDVLKDRIRVLYIASSMNERELLKRYKNREKLGFDVKSEEETMQTISSVKNMSSILSSAARLNYLTKIEEVLPLLNEQWNNYVPYFSTIKGRSLNIRMLYNRYIDNIVEIDHPILNFYDLEYMFAQVRSIVTSSTTKRLIKAPPVFMVCAAPSSGKATLMDIIGYLGKVNINIVITTKYATRDSRTLDGRDGMKALGRLNNPDDKDEAIAKFSEKYIRDVSNIWCWNFHHGSKKTWYAVDHSEIRRNISQGKAQIFISNMGQIENALKHYPDHIVVLYLHATHESETKKHIRDKRKEELIRDIQNQLSSSEQTTDMQFLEEHFNADKEMQWEFNHRVGEEQEEIKSIHYDFKENNLLIDHVLLNTDTREDLVEQMINLINHYSD